MRCLLLWRVPLPPYLRGSRYQGQFKQVTGLLPLGRKRPLWWLYVLHCLNGQTPVPTNKPPFPQEAAKNCHFLLLKGQISYSYLLSPDLPASQYWAQSLTRTSYCQTSSCLLDLHAARASCEGLCTLLGPAWSDACSGDLPPISSAAGGANTHVRHASLLVVRHGGSLQQTNGTSAQTDQGAPGQHTGA